MSQPKLHHWWPQFHQPYWADPNGNTFRIQKDKFFKIGPRANAAIKDDNTITMPDGSKNVTVEEWFSQKVEGPAAAAFEKLKDFTKAPLYPVACRAGSERIGGIVGGKHLVRDLAITPEHRLALARYLGAMVVRVPSYRAQISGVLKVLRERAFKEKGVQIPEPTGVENRNDQIQWMLRHLEDFAAVISGSPWLGFESPEASPFIFGDTPVIPYAQPEGDSMVVPVLPKLALSITQAPTGDRRNSVIPVILCGEVLVADYNDKTIGQSRVAVFSDRQPSEKLCKDVICELGYVSTASRRSERRGCTTMVGRNVIRR